MKRIKITSKRAPRIRTTSPKQPTVDPKIVKAVLLSLALRAEEQDRIAKENAKRIAKENSAFARMPKRAQRLTLAKDVLAALKVKKLVAKSGQWISIPLKGIHEVQLGELIQNAEKCNVCVLGALLACAVVRANHLTVNDIDLDKKSVNVKDAASVLEYLSEFFPREQLRLMEVTFENGKGMYHMSKEDLEDAAIKYGKSFRSPEARLVSIMRNVVKNKGIFVLPKTKKSSRA